LMPMGCFWSPCRFAPVGTLTAIIRGACSKVAAVMAIGLVLAACSTSPLGSRARATAEACSVFSRHYGLKQIEMAARDGQRSGDAELAREARQLQKDLAQPYVGVPALADITRMTDRCRQLGFPIASEGQK
jgi:hypothetical protein